MKILLAAVAVIVLIATGARAETTNGLSEKEIQGQALAQQLYQAKPAENLASTGILKMRDRAGRSTVVPITFNVTVTTTNWQTIYTAGSNRLDSGSVLVIHADGQPNVYYPNLNNAPGILEKMTPAELIEPFAPGSDFWIADLGLEFFHWPQQKVLKKEVHRSCGCTVLESTNPTPSATGYSRVVSWIDTETLGIVEAYAYDAKGKQLKDFYPKDFKKVNGHWQVQTLVMENVQTGSRSRLEFDLKK